jgi:gliding motility-associated-like protein
LTNEFGCDSIVTTITTLLPSYDIVIEETSCNPADTGVFVQNLIAVEGCDSIVTIITSYIPVFELVINLESCNPVDTGVIVENFTSINGCDSVITTITTLLPSFDIVINSSSCNPTDTGVVVQNLTSSQGCDSIITIITTLIPSLNLPDSVTIACDPATGLADYCLPVPYTQFNGYDMLINGEVYFDLPFICDVDTLGGYDFSTAISQGTFGGNNHILLNWSIEGVEQVDVNFNFGTLGELAAYMNGKHAVGEFVSTTNNRIEGGKPGVTYGSLRVFSPELGAIAIVTHNFGLVSKGTLIEGLSEGEYTITLINKVSGCIDSVVVTVACPVIATKDTLIIEAGEEDSIITVCLPFGDILQINENIDSADICGQGTSSQVIAIDSNCVSISINNKPFTGTDTLCVIHCSNGVCDTTIIIVVPVEEVEIKIDTVIIAVRNKGLIELCFLNDVIEVDATYDSVLICGEGRQSTLLTDNDTACVTLVVDTATFLGADTLCVIHCTDGLCDTTIIIPIKVKLDEIVNTDSFICLDNLIDWPGIIGEKFIICAENIDTVIFTSDSLCKEGVVVTIIDETIPGRVCVVHCDTIAGVCDTTIINIPVTIFVPPIAVNDFASTGVAQPVVIDVLANDTFQPPIFVIGFVDQNGNISTTATTFNSGVFVVNPDQTVTYTPNPRYVGGLDSIMYVICNVSSNAMECSAINVDTAWIVISIRECEGGLPQAITPNQDGFNDRLDIACIIGKENVELLIYNRWGNEVYRNINYERVNYSMDAWNGIYNTKPLPEGVYYYVIRFIDELGNQVTLADFVTIIR